MISRQDSRRDALHDPGSMFPLRGLANLGYLTPRGHRHSVFFSVFSQRPVSDPMDGELDGL